MRTLFSFRTLPLFLLIFAVMTFSACGGEKATEEATVEETAPPPPPPPAPAPKQRAEVKQKAKPQETPEEFVMVEEDEVETVEEVEFIPHRFSYEDLETESEPLHISMKAFDEPPVYGKKCADDKHPDECSHDAIQIYMKNGLNKYEDQMDELEDITEYVSFIVEADGSIKTSDIRVLPLEPQCGKCAAIALELIRDMPKWQPATKGGVPVSARVTVPIRFKPPSGG